MPQLDAITPNPKQPKKLFKVNPKRLPVLSPDEVVRRRRLMWGIVGGVTLAVLVIWFSTLGSRLGNVGGDNSAWNTLKQKATDLVSVFRKGGDEKIKNIDVNAPTDADIQYLREQVFPNSGAVTADDAPAKGGSASGGNVNQPTNTNAR
ncbi:MAG: hypothetical protein Q8O51_00535 [bacterium]|nr:hypothetical protein [bacterium]